MISYESYIEQLSKINENDYYRDNIGFDINFDDILDIAPQNTVNRYFLFDEFSFPSFNNFNYIDFTFSRFNREIYSNKNNSFKSANNEFYYSWLPIFIDENHFQKNKTTILNYFSILKYGNSGLKQYDFHIQYIFEIMPNILSEMIKKMSNENNISSSFLNCFFQYILLYKKLEKKNSKLFSLYQIFYLDKKIKDILNYKDIDIIKQLLELFILFFYSNNNVKIGAKQKISDYLIKMKNLLCLELFSDREDFIFENHNIFLNDLKRYKLFYKIVDIIFFDKEFLLENKLMISEISRNKIIRKVNKNFKQLYSELNYETKQVINKLIINNLDFSKYFNINTTYFYLLTPYSYMIYDKGKNPLSKTYKYFWIFKILKDKIFEENFLKNLENNYGNFIGIEDFIKEINMKLKNTEININFRLIFDKYNYLKNINDIILFLTLKNTNSNFYFKKINHIFKNSYLWMIKKDKFLCSKSIHFLMREENEACLRYNRNYTKLKRQFTCEQNKNKDKEKYKRKTEIIKIKKSSNKVQKNGYKKNYR